MRSLIDILDLSVEELDELIKTASDIQENPEKYRDKCRGKKLATLFFEPSTRTRLSFEAAMYELGGNVLSMPDGAVSSASKGESIGDTAKIVSCYADIIAMRHPMAGAALAAARRSDIPVINAGDGGHCHPTQTLADMYTIFRKKGRFDSLTVGLCGDLRYGRTVHSLINSLSRYENVKFILISPKELSLPVYVKKDAEKRKSYCFEETVYLEDVIGKLDILYMTRIQKERFDELETYERLKDSYSLTEEKMKLAKKDCIVLHPLPRVNEISVKVDADERACYFEQALGGKFMRMALILKLLSEKDKVQQETYIKGGKCINPRCITSVEQEIEHLYRDDDRVKRCAYCDEAVYGL